MHIIPLGHVDDESWSLCQRDGLPYLRSRDQRVRADMALFVAGHLSVAEGWLQEVESWIAAHRYMAKATEDQWIERDIWAAVNHAADILRAAQAKEAA